tara:strand:- start:1262 stop:2119 length:858 start_codon:yes stop_codon:yes gene_type:complete
MKKLILILFIALVFSCTDKDSVQYSYYDSGAIKAKCIQCLNKDAGHVGEHIVYYESGEVKYEGPYRAASSGGSSFVKPLWFHRDKNGEIIGSINVNTGETFGEMKNTFGSPKRTLIDSIIESYYDNTYLTSEDDNIEMWAPYMAAEYSFLKEMEGTLIGSIIVKKKSLESGETNEPFSDQSREASKELYRSSIEFISSRYEMNESFQNLKKSRYFEPQADQSLEASKRVYRQGYSDGETGYGLPASARASAQEYYMAAGYNFPRADYNVYVMGYNDALNGKPRRY